MAPRRTAEKKTPKKMGRRGKIKEVDCVSAFLKHIESAQTIAAAAALSGTCKATVMNWLSAAREGDGRYLDFLDQFTRARGKAQAAAVARIRRLGAEDWKSEAWLIERMWPSEFNLRQQLEVSGADGGPVAVSAGVNVVIESSAANGSASNNLTPFSDERAHSPWYGRNGLVTDAAGHVYDQGGILLGVVRSLPAERAPTSQAQASKPMSHPMPATTMAPTAPNLEQAARIAQLTQEIAALKARQQSNNGVGSVPGRLSQVLH
jgi:hypothetical protein